MPFTNYTSIAEAARARAVTLRFEEFIALLALPVSEPLRADLLFARDHVAFDSSESAVCESLIYPMLREVWKHYTDHLTLWSHMPLSYNADLSGTPAYFLARKSPLGHWVMERPHLLVMEAKKDDFSRGWGQCLAAMLAARQLNEQPAVPVYGITTNGRVWEFGRLDPTGLARDPRQFTLAHLEKLCAAINYLFDQCRRQVVDPSQAA
jgi:hypothetical protein